MNRFFALTLAIALIAAVMTSPTIAGFVDGVTYNDVFVSGTYGYDTFRIPSIVSLDDGTLLAFAEGRVNNHFDSGDIDIVLSRSTDYGTTWSVPNVVWSNADGVAGNPCPVVDQKTGNVVLISTHQTPGTNQTDIRQGIGERTYQCQISSDGGLSWTNPSQIMAIESVDPYWLAGGPNHAIQLQRQGNAGRLVLAGNHSVYTTETQSPDYYASNRLHTIYSDDGGLTWQLGAVSDPSGDIYVSEVAATELFGGSLYFTIRNQNGPAAGTRAFVTSHDAGESFDDNLQMDPTAIAPVCHGSILEYSAVDLGDSTNRVIMSYPNSTVRENIAVRSSFDNCQTWTAPKVIYNGVTAYSDLIRTGSTNDQVGVIFERDGYDKITFATFSPEWLDEGTNDSRSWPSIYASKILKDNPIVYYRMEERYGGILHDISGNELHGSLQGNGTLTYKEANPLAQDPGNKAMAFDGDVYFCIPDNDLLDFGTSQDFSVELWANTTSDNVAFFAKGDTNANVWMRFRDGQIQALLDYGDTDDRVIIPNNTPARDGQWHQFVLVADRDSAIQVYIDGVLIAEDTEILGGNISTDLAMTLAQMNSGYFFDGSLDEFAIFGEALTDQQVLEHYNAAAGDALTPGDANGDGMVDGSDVTILANHWQMGVGEEDPGATWAMGDFNGDGQVDGSDVTILANQWQHGVTAGIATIPEPSNILLLFSAMTCLFFVRRR